MSVGTAIKKLRRDRNMTQEQLAEYLGVSANAVSQWECDKTAPDISQIPVLASLFEVSADVLLEIDIAKSKKQAEINDFVKKNTELHSEGKNAQRLELCRRMQKKYPNDDTVKYHLMCVLQNGYIHENRDEIIVLGESLLSCRNTEYRFGAIRGLCFTYLETGNRAKALEYAKMMPEGEDLAVHVLQGKELVRHCQEFFRKICDRMYVQLNYLLGCNENGYTDEQKHELRNRLYDIYHIIFPDEDFGFSEDYLGRICFFMAMDSMRTGEHERAVQELEKMVFHIERFNRVTSIRYTSLFVNHLTVHRSDFVKHSEEPLARVLLRYLNNNERLFEPISKDQRFIEIIKCLSVM